MALAILEPEEFGATGVRFKIDTGTNRYYRFKIGKTVENRYGMDWVDEIFFTTPIHANDNGGSLLNSTKDVVIHVHQPENEAPYVYVQLLTFKGLDGRSPAISKVVKVPRAAATGDLDLIASLSKATTMTMATTFSTPRMAIPCMTYADRYSRPTSLEDLLSGILKVAAPVLINLLSGQKKDGQSDQSAAGSGNNKGIVDVLGNLLKAVLGNAQGAPAVAQSLSLDGRQRVDNRFSQPFVFGIDDVLFGQLVGQFVQILPQLANAATQQRVQLKQANNKLITDILSDVNRRMLLEQLLQAQRQPQSGTPPTDPAALNQLIQLLQQAAPEAGASTPAGAAASSTTKSLSDDGPSAQMSRAVLAFSMADPVLWNGNPKPLFSKGSRVQIKLKLVVGDPVPKAPLSKAIFKFTFKDASDSSIRFEKTFKQKGIVPNSDIVFAFSAADLAGLPTNRNLTVLAEMKWLSSTGRSEFKALGSSEIVLLDKYFLEKQGAAVAPERELTNVEQFRPFWNKIWEAPSLDAANNPAGEDKKYLWELDVNAKYSVLLSPEHSANGLMKTTILRAAEEEQDLAARTAGRMKAGIELSMAELNKLIPLWEGESPLDPERLAALSTSAVAKSAASEFVYPLKLKGRTSERGMVWVGPVFRLFEFTIGAVQKTDENGQVVLANEEKVRYPLPVAARILGLKSGT